MKKSIKKVIEKLLYQGVMVGSKTLISDMLRDLKKVDEKIIIQYLNKTPIKKLQIGSGDNLFNGWLNTNYISSSDDILQLDATNTFPFNDNQFHYIYSEHMIEHITYPQGHKMISECIRVLKPDGKLRISTPDLSFLIGLYGSDKTQLQKDFIKHSTDRWLEYAPKYEDTFVINNYVRAWGHQFIYDEKVLRALFESVGFINIKRFEVSESEDDELRNLENIDRKPEGMIGLESFVLEGTKPSVSFMVKP